MAGPGLDYEILGAVKVKDGLFIGDELAAGDLEFIVSNKVTRVINCAGRQIPNHWESIGVIYLTYYWVDADNQVILDQRDVVANEIFRFIEEALAGAESVLIHSVRGQSRSCCVLSAYMMKKYSWGLRKTMEFLSFRRPDMNLKPAFLDQLSGYESCLMNQAKQTFTMDWNEGNFKSLECEDLLLRNTYINSQMGPPADFQTNDGAGQPRKLLWRDEDPHEDGKIEKPAGADRHNLQNLDPNSPNGFHLRGALKKGTAIPGVDPLGPNSRRGHLSQQAQASAEVWSSGPSQDSQAYGGSMGAAYSSSLNASIGAGMGPGSAMASSGGALGSSGPVRSMPAPIKAWAEGDSHPGRPLPQHAAPAAPAVRAVPDPPYMAYDSDPRGDPRHRAPSPSVQVIDEGRRPVKAERAPPQRAPATNIRDSLVKARRDMPDHRPPSRDPSPKTTVEQRLGATPTRGESPMRYPTRRGSSPGTGGYGGPPRNSASSNPSVSLSGVRTTSFVPSNPAIGSSRPSQGMGAFRSGGPVRAKAEVLSDTSQPRRQRPQTAPSSRPGVGSRPASPMGQQRSGHGSNRPASPHGRPSSGMSSSAPPRPSASGYPTPQAGPRNLSAHMRRAPSPTPAFNRPPSPSKPRWRS